MALSQSEIDRLTAENKSGFNYRLPDGTIIPTSVNPASAATVDTVGVILGRTAAPIPPSILTLARTQYSAPATPQTEESLRAIEASRGGFVSDLGTADGVADPLNPNTPRPFGADTLPSGALTPEAKAREAAIGQASRILTFGPESTGGSSAYASGGNPADLPAGFPDGLPPEFQEIYTALEGYLKELERRGQVINPNVEITPEKLAEFTRQAEQEIDPYYKNQLKIAREGFLRSVGYSSEDILRQEQESERKYKQQFRQIGEEAADTGFALSGRRVQSENELAANTQEEIDARRRNFNFDAGTAARKFAQAYGTAETPKLSLGETPRVFGGETGFNKSSRELPFYELSPETYNGLVGEQEFQRLGQVKGRASELEEAFRTKQALQQERQLIL